MLQMAISVTQQNRLSPVVVQAVGGSSPLAHPSHGSSSDWESSVRDRGSDRRLSYAGR